MLKESFRLLCNQLRAEDKVSIVVYAGAAGVVLPPTSGAKKLTIVEALNSLEAGGSTAGGAGIELAYKLCMDNFIKNGNNRVILATDGDFNIGVSSEIELEKLISDKRKTGIYLSVLGFGTGNYKDSKVKALAQKGNGNYAYINSLKEAKKHLVESFGSTLFTVAKDVKIQVEFNHAQVQSYRLIGYENRILDDEDFVNDEVDAAEMGAGHNVTALYEIIPVGVKSKFNVKTKNLKYNSKSEKVHTDELLTVKVRYKEAKSSKSKELIETLETSQKIEEDTDLNFIQALSWFGLYLRKSELIDNKNIDSIISLAENGVGEDKENYRAEFIELMQAYKKL